MQIEELKELYKSCIKDKLLGKNIEKKDFSFVQDNL